MFINELPKIMLICLMVTILAEVFLAIVLGIRSKKDIINITLVNILTNPLLVSITVTINFYLGLKARHIGSFFLEITVFLVEAMIYKNVLENKKINPYLLSLLLNVFSYIVGLIIFMN